ncbi:MAG: maltose alpha-D-glucosyltransferase [Xanthobacteraceae bacterium]
MLETSPASSPQVAADSHPVDELWYKDAIIYQLHVKAFADHNSDGIGDFTGLTERLDYLQDLGVTALWLLPFYPSPGRDDGYDIADYRRINPDFGTMKDFRRFMTEAHRRGLRVITELVVNHTSDEHPWFKRARRSRPGSDARNWYVWSDTDQRYLDTRIIFNDTEKSNWAWDAEAGAYYWHRFFSHQPDLNFDNPRVLWAIIQVMRRWLDMGVDGFRLDAIPYLCEREGTNNENLPETHAVIKRIRAELDSYARGRLLLAEANQWPEDVSAYFGEGDECHMAYHFPLMPRIYMAIAREDRFPITDILRQTPDIPANCQWALFLRNHDELTLEMVTDAERDYLWSTYAADPRARINLGIRRRLAPLMDNDRRKIELMNSLLMSFPGTPIIYYGDEIGMGDNIYLGDRNGVRTPMQWTPDRNGGFSRCDPAKLYLPMIMDPVYGYQAVNVEAQSRSLSSLLNWMKRLIAVRKSSQVLGRGSLTFLRPSNRSVLVYVRQYEGEVILCVANLSRSAQAAQIDLSEWRGRVPLELLGRTQFPAIGETPYLVTLAPYGFFWFYLRERVEPSSETTIAPEVVTLVMGDGWASLVEGRSRRTLERDVLPNFLPARRWFADKDSDLQTASLQTAIRLSSGDPGFMLTLIEATTRRGTSRYVLPLTVKWGRFDGIGANLAHVVAGVRRGPREGTMLDACADRDFVALLLRNIHDAETIEAGHCRVAFRPTQVFKAMPAPQIEGAHALEREQSNTTVIADSAFVVKILRRVTVGAHPEAEMGRFLTDVAGYQNTPPLLGTIELIEGQDSSTLAVIHKFVGNQGDAWSVSDAYLDRYIDEQRVLAAGAPAEGTEEAAYLHRMRQIGRRTAELHNALASRPDIADFAPEPISAEDVSSWTSALLLRAERTLDGLAARLDRLSGTGRANAEILLERRDEARVKIRTCLPDRVDAVRIRHHGDFHLGQMLFAKDDVYIIDFEGEPQRDLAERRRKMPAARDAAGLIRSLDYSAAGAFDRAVQAWPDDHSRMLQALAHWRESSVQAFLSSYQEALTNPVLWPSNPDDSNRLLKFFLLEKAFYEIEYELANRPTWLHIPLAGARRILFAHEGEG